ncbi:MAG: pirin family protein, partial [Firmicutes bacterium]|nr:pirin family protein [Bacillota bacterium]
MFEVYKKATLGHADYGWLKPRYHFSFASYYNPKKLGIGPLRVLNDDLVFPNGGFEPHPHKDMEIITYIIRGELTHTDSMGNTRKISRGSVQYMSAGTGVVHSEFNYGSEVLRLLQIWIHPNQKNLIPNYGDKQFEKSKRHNQLLHLVSNKDGNGAIQINQDVNIYVIEIDENNKENVHLDQNRSIYLVQMEGSSLINDHLLEEGDALYTTESI